MKITLPRSDIEEALKLLLETKYKFPVSRFEVKFRFWDDEILEYELVDVDEVLISPKGGSEDK